VEICHDSCNTGLISVRDSTLSERLQEYVHVCVYVKFGSIYHLYRDKWPSIIFFISMSHYYPIHVQLSRVGDWEFYPCMNSKKTIGGDYIRLDRLYVVDAYRDL